MDTGPDGKRTCETTRRINGGWLIYDCVDCIHACGCSVLLLYRPSRMHYIYTSLFKAECRLQEGDPKFHADQECEFEPGKVKSPYIAVVSGGSEGPLRPRPPWLDAKFFILFIYLLKTTEGPEVRLHYPVKIRKKYSDKR
jgi:hypothetical protein